MAARKAVQTTKRAKAAARSKPAASLVPTSPRFFATQKAWRAWLAKHHARETMLWVGFWRVATGKPSITWPQSVDEALCFGWIDGLRRGLDDERYAIRFTPRGAKTVWSRVNLKRYAELEAAGLVSDAGKRERAKWSDDRSSGYSFETPNAGLDAAGLKALTKDAQAKRWWDAQTPGYRKMAGHWVTSAKREQTRAARLATLIDCCRRGVAIPPVAKWIQVKPVG